MRQTVKTAGILATFLLTLTNIYAEPVVRGFFIEKLPGKSSAQKLAPGKGLVLAHVFNSGEQAINSGNYEIGVEIENSGKKARYALKPDAIISAGTIKTFRMAVPVSEQAKKDGYFRVFSKVKGKMVWSDQYSFLQGALATDEDSITTLYTEAPMVDSVKPPAKIKFENEIKTKKVEKTVVVKQPISKKSEKSTDKNKEEKKTELAKTSKPEAPVSVTKSAPPTRNIDLSEFKKLRTIDEELIIYVIKDGDTLKSVAQKYYGAQSKERAIADLNFIDNPSSIKVGEEIIVDVKPLGKADKVKTAVRNSNISQVFAPEGKTTYTIKKGDTLGKIARQFYGRISDVSKLMKANPGLKPTNLRIGDVIIIPDRGDNA